MKNKILNILKNPLFYLFLILCIGFLVRLYKIDNPIADWHSWRQADTAAVSRNFYKETFPPPAGERKEDFTLGYFIKMVMIPRYDDMTGAAQNPVPNPQRYRFVEFPIQNLLIYFAYLIHGGVDEKLARLVSIFFSLGSTVFIYFITKRYFGLVTAFLSALLFAILPFNIYFSRVILPEPVLVFFSLGMFYFFDRWIWENTPKLYFLSLFFTAFAFLLKPMAVFYLVPLVYSYYQKEKRWWPIPRRYYYLLVPAMLPFIGWRIWMNQHPEGIPASNWLFNGNGIRFRPAFWKWIIGDRFGREILSVAGSILFFLGMIIKPKVNEGWLLHLLALFSLLFLIVFATGNVQHDYYQTLIIPALVIFTARGAVLLFRGIPEFAPRIWTIPLGLFLLILTIYLSWMEVKGLYQVNNWAIVEAGKKADQLLPKDAIVVAPYGGDTSFLYQTNRHGWPVVAFPIKDLIDRYNTNYFISTAQDAKTKWVMRKYTVLVETKNYVIVDLTHENPNFDYYHDPEP